MWAIVRFAKCQPYLGEFSGEIKTQYFPTHSFYRSAQFYNNTINLTMNIFKILTLATLVFHTSCTNDSTTRYTAKMSYTVEVDGKNQAETSVNQTNTATTTPMTRNLTNSNAEANRIQIALLLDTSNSMDGLIDQAKSQLWKMVNELADSKKNGESPDIDIALYEYGNSKLAERDGFIKQIVPMTTDLDAVSEKLFELTTSGGDEYCGQVVLTSANDLKWSESLDDFKLIIIAGNEPYTQGPVDYKDACVAANEKRITVNTIFCGDYEKGIATQWRDGADCTNGKYMNINHNDKVVHIPTPYDDEIIELNKSLNKTYVGYGSLGRKNKERQATQDSNAAAYSHSNVAERAVSKSKKQYKNTSWDLVDAVEEDAEIVVELEEEQLPDEMKKMSDEERKTYIEEKSAERKEIQSKINKLDKKRREFKAEKQKENAKALTLDKVMLKAIRELAEERGFTFDEK